MEWAAHRVITLLVPCEEEQWIRMQLLRDPDWFRMMAPEVGETIFLDMPEMGVEGDAIVEAIELCPEIEIGEGQVVTATFHHSTGECLELDIEGEDSPLRVTAGHPIWRVDRNDAQGEALDSTGCCSDSSLCGCDIAGQPADTVSTAHGIAKISAIRLDQTSCPVFNIDVQGDHVYRVASSAVRVHNASPITPGADYGYENQAGSGDSPCNREKLRRNQNGCNTGFVAQAHHVIPCNSSGSTAIQRAVLLGLDLNGVRNGWCLPSVRTSDAVTRRKMPLHSGSHPR